jgi:hypothetical protein
MRSFSLPALGLARTRSDTMMTRIARALVDAELSDSVELDAPSAVRFLDSMEELLSKVPYASMRLAQRLAQHSSPAVRRAAAGATRAMTANFAAEAEAILAELAADPQAPVRSAASRALGTIVATSRDPMEIVERWLAGSPEQRDAIERARRRLPAPIGTAPARKH